MRRCDHLDPIARSSARGGSCRNAPTHGPALQLGFLTCLDVRTAPRGTLRHSGKRASKRIARYWLLGTADAVLKAMSQSRTSALGRIGGVTLSAILASCGGSSSSAQPTTDASLMDAPLDATALDADGAPPRAAPSDATLDEDAGADGDAGCLSQPQADDPARTVTFVLTNSSTQPRYVIASSNNCQPYQVDDYDPAPPPSFSIFDTCEGLDAGATAGFATLAPGATYTFTWDGRYPVPYTTLYACGQGLGCSNRNYSARRLAPGGAHSASFVVADDMPTFVPLTADGLADAAVPCTSPCPSSVWGGSATRATSCPRS